MGSPGKVTTNDQAKMFVFVGSNYGGVVKNWFRIVSVLLFFACYHKSCF